MITHAHSNNGLVIVSNPDHSLRSTGCIGLHAGDAIQIALRRERSGFETRFSQWFKFDLFTNANQLKIIINFRNFEMV